MGVGFVIGFSTQMSSWARFNETVISSLSASSATRKSWENTGPFPWKSSRRRSEFPIAVISSSRDEAPALEHRRYHRRAGLYRRGFGQTARRRGPFLAARFAVLRYPANRNR